MVSLKDISAACKVSVATVSKALNDQSDISEATKERVRAVAKELGYCCKTRKNRMSYLEHAKYRGFDGVVIACIDFNDPEVMELVKSKIPIVTIDHVFHNRITIISDNVRGMRELFTYVYEKGHRRIAYIHGADSAVTQARVTSFYRTAQELE